VVSPAHGPFATRLLESHAVQPVAVLGAYGIRPLEVGIEVTLTITTRHD
jgi:hypothetical protein